MKPFAKLRLSPLAICRDNAIIAVAIIAAFFDMPIVRPPLSFPAIQDDVDDAVQFIPRQRGSRRQAKPAVEDVLGYAADDDSGGMGLFGLIVVFGVAAVDPEYGLEMHGLPDGTGFDVFFFKGEADGFAVRAKGVRGDQDDGQPAVGGSVGGFGHEVDAGDIFKGLEIVMLAACRFSIVQDGSAPRRSETGGRWSC
jgi:hypothetical protein